MAMKYYSKFQIYPLSCHIKKHAITTQLKDGWTKNPKITSILGRRQT
jgi:hypothetical protein